MMGDNLYGGDAPKDYQKAFEVPYKPLLDAGVKFYASLGNHDNPNQRLYKPFNMNGERYYTFKPGRVRACASSRSTATTSTTSSWRGSTRSWPPAARTGRSCSSTIRCTRPAKRTGPPTSQRELLEPVFLKHGVNVVLSGHEHFYERIKPQKGHRLLHPRKLRQAAARATCSRPT